MISDTNELITRFGWADYLVFVMMLFISTAIGVFFGCSGTKQKSTSEFFMGGRTMGVFPVAMSLAARLSHPFINKNKLFVITFISLQFAYTSTMN